MYSVSNEYILVAEYSTFLLKFIEIRFIKLTLVQDKPFSVKNVFHYLFFTLNGCMHSGIYTST